MYSAYAFSFTKILTFHVNFPSKTGDRRDCLRAQDFDLAGLELLGRCLGGRGAEMVWPVSGGFPSAVK